MMYMFFAPVWTTDAQLWGIMTQQFVTLYSSMFFMVMSVWAPASFRTPVPGHSVAGLCSSNAVSHECRGFPPSMLLLWIIALTVCATYLLLHAMVRANAAAATKSLPEQQQAQAENGERVPSEPTSPTAPLDKEDNGATEGRGDSEPTDQLEVASGRAVDGETVLQVGDVELTEAQRSSRVSDSDGSGRV